MDRSMKDCKKHKISFDRILTDEDGNYSIFHGEQQVAKLKFN
jgi:hypothetical protein